MASTPSKTLSPAELIKLEQAFAAEPLSDAYRPLAEAYLGMGRFMEAMVVCKKGVKAHPDKPEPRLLLARVYGDQGKDKKALEELTAALAVAPNDKSILRMTGALQLKLGEAEPGKANLLKAYAADPADAETQAAMAQWKVEAPKPAAPEPPTERVPTQAPMAGPGTRAPGVGQGRPASSATHAAAAAPPRLSPMEAGAPMTAEDIAQAPTRPVRVPSATPAPAARARGNGAPARGGAPAVTRTPSQQRPAPPRAFVPPPEEHDEDDDELSDARSRRRVKSKSKNATKAIFALLIIALPLTLGAYFFVGQWRARRNREFNKKLAETTEQLKHDSYESYKKASTLADEALELKPDSGAAHSYLAYAYAIRWGEHGGGDAARASAEQHLKAAQQAAETSSYLYAADALIQTYGGKGPAALNELESRVKAFDAEGKKSSLLYLTLGLIQMNAGDLDRAKESLETAQGLAPDDPRIYSALGTLYRRMGQDRLAWQSYDFALRYEKDHPESVLGRSLLILDLDSPEPAQYAVAARMLKRLLESEPPPSPRQLAMAHAARALLVSRVAAELPKLKPETQKELSESTGVSADKAQAEIAELEGKAFDLDRANPELNLIKGRRLALEGNLDAAITEIRKAAQADPSRAQFHVELAKVLMRKPGGEGEAKDALVTALKTMGDSPKLLVMLGDAYRKMGKTDDALAQYTRAVADPKAKAPDARLALGTLYRERRDYAKAQEALEKAAQEYVGQATKVAVAYTELARVFEEKGDRAKADETYQKALNADVDYAPAYFFYARFLAQDRTAAGKARTTAQEYLKRDPRGEYAAEAQRLL